MEDTKYISVPVKKNYKEIKNGKGNSSTKYGLGVRHVQVFLAFTALSLAFVARGHLGVTIIAMTMVGNNVSNTVEIQKVLNNTEEVNYITKGQANESLKTIEENINSIYRTFHWSKSTQEVIHGSFFLGYLIMMFPMGMVCQRWGGIVPLQIAMFVNGVLSLLTPWLVNWGDWKMLSIIRFTQGLSKAGLFPSTTALMSSWVPLCERATLSSFLHIGSGVGTIIAFQLGGILAFSKFGWPSTFWVTGVACLIGLIFITIFGAASPMEHKSISEEEKLFLMGEIKDVVRTDKKVPWKSMFRSVPAWATCIAHTGNAMCFLFIFIQLPTYMYSILKLDIRVSGVLSSLPYFASIFASIAFGFTSDFFTNRNIIRIKNARRLSNSIGCVVPALCLILVSYTINTTLAVACLVVSLAANSAVHTGWVVNYIDLTPNYSGTLISIGNTLNNSVMLTLPVTVSYIVTDVTNQLQWRMMMFLVSGFTLACNIIFVIFMSSEVQPWDNSDNVINDEEDGIKLKPEAKQDTSEKDKKT